MIRRVLVIKLGALGDFVLALGPFAAIRKAHPQARITLLTTAPFEGIARAAPYFDEVWLDDRPSLARPAAWLALRRRLLGGRFDFIYDLQTSDRSGWYFRLMGPGRRPLWSGAIRGCSHPHDNPRRDFMHTLERQAEQLAQAGIGDIPPPDLSWTAADVARFRLSARYALLVPGGAAHRPRKRWPAEHYGALALDLAAREIEPVILGADSERPIARTIRDSCPEAHSLVGETGLADIAALARGAAGAIGNDTGPMHLIAAAGCPALVLFSAESNPSLTQPRGPCVEVLRRDDLSGLCVSDVVAAARLR
jgi:ADP-heptose:LPS heptosyltransferase